MFCNTYFDFLPRFGLGVPFGLLLGARSWICCFSEVRVRILKIPFSYSPPLLMLGAALGYGWTCYGATLFSKELPTCAIIYDVLLELPPHITDATFKSSSLKAFLEKGQIPEFSNTAQVFFTIHETASAEVIILVRSRTLTFFFFRTGLHPVILCNSVFCLKRPQT